MIWQASSYSEGHPVIVLTAAAFSPPTPTHLRPLEPPGHLPWTWEAPLSTGWFTAKLAHLPNGFGALGSGVTMTPKIYMATV